MSLFETECDRFDHAWSRGQQPLIEDVLSSVSALLHPTLLAELILVEVWYRQRNGEQPELDEYLQRFADQSDPTGLPCRAWGSGVSARAVVLGFY